MESKVIFMLSSGFVGDSPKSCKPCPAGSFCKGGSGMHCSAPKHRDDSPESRKDGQNAFAHPDEASPCSSAAIEVCPPHSHSSANGASCTCDDGYHGFSLSPSQLVCQRCPPNTFCTGNLVSNCTDNSFAPSGAASRTVTPSIAVIAGRAATHQPKRLATSFPQHLCKSP